MHTHTHIFIFQYIRNRENNGKKTKNRTAAAAAGIVKEEKLHGATRCDKVVHVYQTQRFNRLIQLKSNRSW